ncbi:MAG: transcriptional regulator, TetR family [Acidimicrobiales bacterium]|jgi:AcrR family transcriptional regulator|nr:transcriptional regulator, TetR family [Acidimicrobiales bacterium]
MSAAGEATREAVLDAAEELLISKGVSDITTRKVADKAGVNQALIHYHFGTIEELLIAVLERVSQSVKERATRIYEDEDGLFLDGWFTEMQAMTTTDFERGWGKIWLENLTLAANRPKIAKQYGKASSMVRKLHERQVAEMLARLGIDPTEFPPQAIVTLLDAVTSKIILDRLVGIRTGHQELLLLLRRLWDQVEKPAASELLT